MEFTEARDARGRRFEDVLLPLKELRPLPPHVLLRNGIAPSARIRFRMAPTRELGRNGP